MIAHPLLAKKIQFFTVCSPNGKPLAIPLFNSLVSAGFPSPATDYIELELDFNSLLVSRPSSTFCVRVLGESMKDANIHTGDILVVDKALNAKSGAIVVAILNGEFVVKRLMIEGKHYMLVPENPSYKTIHINSDDDFEIWGIVTYVIHKAQ